MRASHATTGHALGSRQSCVGGFNVWEVSVSEVLSHQTELFTTADAVEVWSPLRYELDECMEVCHQRVREAEELAELARQQETYRTVRPCSDCGVVGLEAVTVLAPDTKTEWLCITVAKKCHELWSLYEHAQNGVLCNM